MKAIKNMSDFSKEKYDSFALVSDIGGTVTPLSLFAKQGKKIEKIFTLSFGSKEITNFSDIINETLKFAYDEFKIQADELNACFGVAGPIKHNRTYSKPTNLKWAVSVEKIKKETFLQNIILVNDFESAGYGIDVLDSEDVIKLNDAKIVSGSVAIIGAGTGLGFSILYFDQERELHIPIPSEGGHQTFAVKNKEEFKIAEFIKTRKKYKDFPGIEQFVSGQGIENLYYYFSKKLKTKNEKIEKAKDKPAEIAKLYSKDKACKSAIDTFVKFYARASSDLALDTLAVNGLYIAGGIAPRLINHFKKKVFINEFNKNYIQSKILKEIPVFVVMNLGIGLLGAANIAFNFFDELKK